MITTELSLQGRGGGFGHCIIIISYTFANYNQTKSKIKSEPKKKVCFKNQQVKICNVT